MELDLEITIEEALAECQRRGALPTSERELAARPGSRHLHLHIPDRAGTLELSESEGRVWVKVHPRREGDWAVALAQELAQLPGPGPGVSLIDRHDIRVMFKRATDEQASITRAWAELENAVGSLRGRKFYGTFDPVSEEYRACVEVRDDDDPETLGLELGSVPGGRFARARLRGEPPGVYQRIRPTFEELARQSTPDSGRLSIEFYRRRDETDLLLPVI